MLTSSAMKPPIRPTAHRARVRIGILVLLALGATGCASTRIVNHWVNPEYAAARFHRLLVIGVSTQSSIRRTFEDEFVASLKAAGVDAVPSHRHIAEDGRVEETRLQQAVREAAADAVLMTRLVQVERRTQVTPGVWAPGPIVGFYPWYTAGWVGYYEPPRVYQYDVYISETSLYDVKRTQMVWTGTAHTTASGNINRDISHYVKKVIKALEHDHVLVDAT
jgi:hypothetical protein